MPRHFRLKPAIVPAAPAIDGGPGPDLLDGTARADTIRGFGASDTLNGLAGGDSLLGAPGRDILRGGADSGALCGGETGDRLGASAGNGFLDGGTGSDGLHGGLAPTASASAPTAIRSSATPGSTGWTHRPGPGAHDKIDISLFVGNDNLSWEAVRAMLTDSAHGPSKPRPPPISRCSSPAFRRTSSAWTVSSFTADPPQHPGGLPIPANRASLRPCASPAFSSPCSFSPPRCRPNASGAT